MNGFKNLLAVVNPGDADPASVACASSLAKAYGAHVSVTGVVEEVSTLARTLLPEQVNEWQAIVAREYQEQLDKQAEAVREEGLECDAELLRGVPPLEIIRKVLRGNHDFVIKDFEADEEGAALAGTDLRLLRKCPCPVWLIRGGKSANVRRILAAVDPQPGDVERNALNLRIVEIAAALAQHMSAELVIFHAWRVMGEGTLDHWINASDVDRYVDQLRESVESVMADLVAAVPAARTATSQIVRGRAETAIPKAVEDQKIDLVVMGTVARTGIPGLLIGNTAERVIAGLNCSLVAVKPEGFETPVKLG